MASSSSSLPSSSTSFDQHQLQTIQTILSDYINRIISETNISFREPLIWGPTNTPNIANLPDEPNPGHILDRITLTSNSSYIFLLIEGSSAVIDLLLHNLGQITGELPASKASIEELPKVEGTIGECAICLDESKAKLGKEMPCKHIFHAKCLEEWLNLHGTCPLCRHKIPINSGEGMKERRLFSLTVSLDDEIDEGA